MAVKFIAPTDTLEKFRTEFNDLSANQFGDIANLSGAISANTIVDAMNETISIATSTAGFTIADDTSSTQIIGGGDTLTVLGTANQIQSVVTPQDTLTLSFPNDVTIPNNLTALGSTHTLGTIEINGSDIRSIDSTGIVVNDALRASKLQTTSGTLTIDESGTAGLPKISSSRTFLLFDATPVMQSSIIFEGASQDDNETTITVTDPTADRTITVPDVTGTIVTTGDTGSITSGMLAADAVTGGSIADDSIGEAKLADDAVGSDQLKSVVNLQILNSSGGVLKQIYGAGA
tara:strand:+ start:45 stop:914 length:870 start_codon:yes stop_codon:yes gene_type:complete